MVKGSSSKRFPTKGVQRYTVAHDSSRRDAADGDEGEGEGAQNGNGDGYNRKEWELAEYGFEDDGYDYSQHFKPMGGHGVFVARDGTVTRELPLLSAQFSEGSTKRTPEQSDAAPAAVVIREVAEDESDGDGEGASDGGDESDEDGKDGVTVAPAMSAAAEVTMKAVKVAAATFVPQDMDDTEEQKAKYVVDHSKDAEREVEAMLQEAGETDDDDGDGAMPDDFIAQMMEGSDDDEGGEHGEGEGEGEEEDYGSDEDGERRVAGEDELTREQFDEVMKGYDDEEIGDLSGDEQTRGAVSVAEILSYLKDDKDMKPKKKQKEMAPLSEDKPTDEEKSKTMLLIKRQVEHSGDREEVAVPVGKRGSDDEGEGGQQRWDCESILTAFGSRANQPAVLDDRPRQRKQQPIIKLSKRTGMPIEALPKKPTPKEEEEEEEEQRPNLGEKRHDETADERRARKKAVREEKKIRREQKKELKEAYKAAEVSQAKLVRSQALNAGGRTVHII